MIKYVIIYLFLLCTFFYPLFSQDSWPVYNEQEIRSDEDWLLDGEQEKAMLYETEDGHLVLSNGLVSRTFAVEPNGATIGLQHLQRNPQSQC